MSEEPLVKAGSPEDLAERRRRLARLREMLMRSASLYAMMACSR